MKEIGMNIRSGEKVKGEDEVTKKTAKGVVVLVEKMTKSTWMTEKEALYSELMEGR